MIAIIENIIAAILYDAAKGIYRGFNNALTKALSDTSVYFATREENPVEFEKDKLEQIIRGEAAAEEIEKLKQGEGFIDKDRLALQFAIWGELYFENESQILPAAKEILDYFLTSFEDYLLQDPKSAPALLRAYIEIFRKQSSQEHEQSSRERETILAHLWELKGLVQGIQRTVQTVYEGLGLYTELKREGASIQSVSVKFVLGIRNDSSLMAKYPEISITTPKDFPIDRWGLDGNGNDGLKRVSRNMIDDNYKYLFKGGANDVVHPKSELKVTCIRLKIPRVAIEFPSISIEYTIQAENFNPVSGEYTLNESELLRWKDKFYREEWNPPAFSVEGLRCASLKCSKYGIEVKDTTAHACGECGQPFGWVCDKCKLLNPNELKDCPRCNRRRQMPVGMWA